MILTFNITEIIGLTRVRTLLLFLKIEAINSFQPPSSY